MKSSDNLGETILAAFVLISVTIIGWYAFNYVFVERTIHYGTPWGPHILRFFCFGPHFASSWISYQSNSGGKRLWLVS